MAQLPESISPPSLASRATFNCRIREAMRLKNPPRKMSGEVEPNETFVGGKVQNMHKKSARRRP
jgi:hypothetical protein